MKLSRIAAGGAVLAVAWLVLQPRVVQQDAPEPRGRTRAAVSPTVSAEPDPVPRDATRAPTGDAPRERARAVDAVPGEDPQTLAWDTMSPEQRRDALGRELHDALAELRRDAPPASARARADSALSALRSELYGTAQGRAEHELLERELDALVERHRAAESEGPT